MRRSRLLLAMVAVLTKEIFWIPEGEVIGTADTLEESTEIENSFWKNHPGSGVSVSDFEEKPRCQSGLDSLNALCEV